MDDDDIELKVCPRCDAPLPNDKRKVTFIGSIVSFKSKAVIDK